MLKGSFILLFSLLCSLVTMLPIAKTDGLCEIWKREFGVNIVGLTVADGKVFVTTHAADLYCLDERDGKTLWKYNFGAYSEGGFLTEPIYAYGLVFVGFRGSRLAAFDAEKGTLLWKFDPNASSSFASKTPPYFWVANGKVFTSGDGFYAVNAKDGKLLWKYADYYTGPWSRPTYVRGIRVEGERVFATGAELVDGEWIDYIYRLNPDDGSILWKSQDSMGDASIVGNEGFLNIYDYYRSQGIVCLNKTLCLNETDGSELWNYSVSGRIFQPTIANELVLFGASDGNFYALNVDDGALEWRYPTGYGKAAGNLNFDAAKVAFNKVFVGYVISSEGSHLDEIKYEGSILCLNQSNGELIWATPISNNTASISSFVTIRLKLENQTLYATTFNDLHCINAENGTIQWTKHFAYWVLPPISAYNKLFVAADLKIIAYGEIEQAKMELPLNQLIIGAIIVTGTGIAVAASVYILRKRHSIQKAT